MSSPAALRAAAARLVAHAQQLPAALDGVAAASGDETWRGPAAQTFAGSLATQRGRLRGVAGQLQHTAARLRQQADEIEAEQRRAAAAVP